MLLKGWTQKRYELIAVALQMDIVAKTKIEPFMVAKRPRSRTNAKQNILRTLHPTRRPYTWIATVFLSYPHFHPRPLPSLPPHPLSSTLHTRRSTLRTPHAYSPIPLPSFLRFQAPHTISLPKHTSRILDRRVALTPPQLTFSYQGRMTLTPQPPLLKSPRLTSNTPHRTVGIFSTRKAKKSPVHCGRQID
jgi:hypothetical protein